MKEFLKRYFILIFLSFLIIILIFLKIIYGDADKNNKIIEVITTPTMIFPDPKTVKLEELKEMDNETLKDYLNQLTEEEINNLPEEIPDWETN